MTMFKTEKNGNVVTLFVELPQGKTQSELVSEAKKEIKNMSSEFFGNHVNINGRLTTAMALMLGHELAHISKSVSMFDPKENEFVLSVGH